MVGTNATIPNPKYYASLRMDKYVGHMKKSLPLSGDINISHPGARFSVRECIPFVCFEKLILRDYQERIFNVGKDYSSWLLEARMATGKSVIAAALCEYWGKSTVIIVHNVDMVKQFKDTLKLFTNLKVGEYHGKKKKLGHVTITTTKSFTDKWYLFKDFNNVIRDEADCYFTEANRAAQSKKDWDHIVGMTGTTKTPYDEYTRKVDPPVIITFYGAHVIYAPPEDEVLKSIQLIKYEKEYLDQYGLTYSPQDDWQAFRKKFDEDFDRIDDQLKFIKQTHKEKDFSLVLLDRVEVVEYMHANTPGSYIIHGKRKKKDRDETLSSFRENGGILFAQYKTAGRGIDIVRLNKCFVFFPIKTESTLRQIAGRVIREYLDKESTVYDWGDSSLSFQQKARTRIFKKSFPNATISVKPFSLTDPSLFDIK